MSEESLMVYLRAASDNQCNPDLFKIKGAYIVYTRSFISVYHEFEIIAYLHAQGQTLSL